MSSADRELEKYLADADEFEKSYPKNSHRAGAQIRIWEEKAINGNSLMKFHVALRCSNNKENLIIDWYMLFIIDSIKKFGIRKELAKYLWQAHLELARRSPSKLKELGIVYLNWSTVEPCIKWLKHGRRETDTIQVCEYAMKHFSHQEGYNASYLYARLCEAWNSIGDKDKADEYALLAQDSNKSTEAAQAMLQISSPSPMPPPMIPYAPAKSSVMAKKSAVPVAPAMVPQMTLPIAAEKRSSPENSNQAAKRQRIVESEGKEFYNKVLELTQENRHRALDAFKKIVYDDLKLSIVNCANSGCTSLTKSLMGVDKSIQKNEIKQFSSDIAEEISSWGFSVTVMEGEIVKLTVSWHQ
jgi:hypothetical protein